jgi:hypothetical protein
VKIQIKEGVITDTLDFQNGEYRRRFNRAEQPFEVSKDEWPALRRSGYFQPYTEPPPPTTTDDKKQGDGKDEQSVTQQPNSPKRAKKADSTQSDQK